MILIRDVRSFTSKYRAIFLISFVVITIGIIGVSSFFLQPRLGKEMVVYIGNDGFSPPGLIVKIGSKVEFKNRRDIPVWPASDVHPTHALYPEFDAKGSIGPGGVWEFTFEQVGTWRYHNHLDPRQRGTIQVVSSDSFIGNTPQEVEAMTVCAAREERYEKVNCWTDYFESVLIKDGVEKAFKIVKRFREADASFAADCHSVVHTIGEVAYWLYADGEKLPKSGIISTCGYGFHHGFMQEFGHHDPKFSEKVPEFCDYFAYKLNYDQYEKSVDPIDQCYHGVGHGLAFSYISQYWDDEVEIVKKGARDCETFSGSEKAVSNCTYGLFGGIASFYTGGHGYKKELDMSDPFRLCKGQEDNLKDACYDSMLPVVWVYTDFNIQKTLFYFSEVKEKEFLKQAMYNFGDILSPKFWLGIVSKEEALTACQSLDGDLRVSCIKGFAEGVIRNGLPQEAVGEAMAFCELLQDTDLRGMCIDGVEKEIKLNYPTK